MSTVENECIRGWFVLSSASFPNIRYGHLTPWSLGGLARRDPERYGKERTIVIVRFT